MSKKTHLVFLELCQKYGKFKMEEYFYFYGRPYDQLLHTLAKSGVNEKYRHAISMSIYAQVGNSDVDSRFHPTSMPGRFNHEMVVSVVNHVLRENERRLGLKKRTLKSGLRWKTIADESLIGRQK